VTNARGTRGTRTGPVALALLVVLALLVAACGDIATRTPAPSAGPATSAPSGEPAPTDEQTGAPTEEPTDEVTEPATEEPSLEPTDTPAPSAGGADACTGTSENRDFYAALASSVAWDVYCPALPPGWFVESGSYRLSSGGQLSITYRGPEGAHLAVREGAYCAGLPDCIPTGTEAGSARFGDRDARLLDLGSGSWLVAAVAEGGDVNWQATGSGMDGAVLAGFTAAFARVGE